MRIECLNRLGKWFAEMDSESIWPCGRDGEIPEAERVDVEGTKHYSILFQNNPARDRAILDFLE